MCDSVRLLFFFSSHPSSRAPASAACRTSACRGPSSSDACSAASSSGDRRRDCRFVGCAVHVRRPTDFFQYQAGAGRLAGRA
jgi:hypothetical protein